MGFMSGKSSSVFVSPPPARSRAATGLVQSTEKRGRAAEKNKACPAGGPPDGQPLVVGYWSKTVSITLINQSIQSG
jgi:hypothetical protein